jgi:hypothetical protein
LWLNCKGVTCYTWSLCIIQQLTNLHYYVIVVKWRHVFSMQKFTHYCILGVVGVAAVNLKEVKEWPMLLRRNNSPAYYWWQIPSLLKCQLRFGFDDLFPSSHLLMLWKELNGIPTCCVTILKHSNAYAHADSELHHVINDSSWI